MTVSEEGRAISYQSKRKRIQFQCICFLFQLTHHKECEFSRQNVCTLTTASVISVTAIYMCIYNSGHNIVCLCVCVVTVVTAQQCHSHTHTHTHRSDVFTIIHSVHT